MAVGQSDMLGKLNKARLQVLSDHMVLRTLKTSVILFNNLIWKIVSLSIFYLNTRYGFLFIVQILPVVSIRAGSLTAFAIIQFNKMQFLK